MRCSTCMLNNPPKKASLLAQKTEKKTTIGISKFHSLFKVYIVIEYIIPYNFQFFLYYFLSILYFIYYREIVLLCVFLC